LAENLANKLNVGRKKACMEAKRWQEKKLAWKLSDGRKKSLYGG
jgi:hypothetical protein